MAKRGDATKQRYWRDVIERQKASGQSIRKFCQTEGISEARFHWWQRRQLRPASSGESAIRPKPGMSKRPARSLANRFLPVEVVKPAVEAPAVEIVLPGGTLARIRSGTDVLWLCELLGALEQRPC
jgi:hypothetical protein